MPSVFVPGWSPLEMSAFAPNRGFNRTVGNLYPVSDATVHARILPDPNVRTAKGLIVEIPVWRLFQRSRQKTPTDLCRTSWPVPRSNVPVCRSRPR